MKRILKINENSIIKPKIAELDTFDMNIQEFIELYNEFLKNKEIQGISERSMQDYKEHLKYFLRFLKDQSDTLNPNITLQTIKLYIYYMKDEKKYSEHTINIRLRTLKAFLNWLYNEGYIKEQVAQKIKLVKTKEDTIEPLSDDEIKKFLKAINTKTYAGFRDFVIVTLILDTGVRIGELVNIKVEDVNFKDRIIKVKGAYSKTRRFRYLPISPKTTKLLQQLIKINQENNVDTEYIFLTQTGNRLSKYQVISQFEKYGKKAKIQKRTTPHVFRHTFAVNCVKAGMDIFTLQRILGHSTIITTRKYIQLNTNDIKAKHEALNIINKYINL